MMQHSISRRLILAVLALELFSALSLVGITIAHETRIRLRAFDMMLHGRADMLLGAVADAEDAVDSVMLNTNGIVLPKQDIFNVEDEDRRTTPDGKASVIRILGRSNRWSADATTAAKIDRNGVLRVSMEGRQYRVVRIHGIRVVDPADKGGVTHFITVLYGSPTDHVWADIREAVRFYGLASLLLLTLTGCVMAWFLRKGMEPLRELANEAARVSGQQWNFKSPESARQTRELAPLAEALEAALDRLQETFQQQKRFTSDAAHELKTDVAIVKSSLQLLAMRTRTVEEYKQGLETSMTDCLRLEGTVYEMLTLAGLQHAAYQDLQTASDSDLVLHAQEAIVRLAPLAGLREVNLKIEVPAGARVPLAAKECSLLCTNLLHNAILHSPRGSQVRLKISCTDHLLQMAVEDDGEGIASDALPHIFEPFFRGDPSRDRRSGGTGLGLPICKAICKGVAGSIEIRSSIGVGTQAMVSLPIAADSQEMTDSGSVIPLPVRQSETVRT
jgi:signal transduction histidine kinase